MPDAEKVAERFWNIANKEDRSLGIQLIAEFLRQRDRETEAKGWAKGFREGREDANKDSKLTEARVWGEAAGRICSDCREKRHLHLDSGKHVHANGTWMMCQAIDFRHKAQEVKEG